MDELRRGVEITQRIAVPEDIGEEVSGGTPSPVVVRAVAAEKRSLPSFFVVGPPRTGSSWLHEVLRPHTLLPSPSKETRFFDTHFHRGLNWYAAHYRDAGGQRRRGEVAPTYFASAAARERMAEVVPEAKIVCVFRNPVDRIVSLYRLKRAYGLIPWGFEEAIERDPELMDSSRYASTLRLWQRSFGVQKVLAGVYDDLRRNPQAFVDSLVDFIGVPRFRLADWQYGRVHDSETMTHPRSYYWTRSATLLAEWFKARRLDLVVRAFKRSRLRKLVLGGGAPFPQLSTDVLSRLHARLRPEIEELEAMVRRDFSGWKLGKTA
jgi:LPS sulfotransferase NodH